MLTLKNPFAKTIPEDTALPSHPAIEASVKGKQLMKGRTKARVESLRTELEAARIALGQAEQTVGDRLLEDLELTAATETMKQASDRVRVLESALAIAIQKDEAAQVELKEAERQLVIEAEAAACARLNALAPRWEAILAGVRQIAMETALAAEGIRVAGGNEKYAYGVKEITAQARLFMGLAMHALTNNGHVPTPFMKYKTLTECLDAVCGRPQQ